MLEVEQWENECGYTLRISEQDAEEIYLKLEQSRKDRGMIQGSNYDIIIERQD